MARRHGRGRVLWHREVGAPAQVRGWRLGARHPWFPKYTDIEHYANYPTAIADGEEVVITEKIHGTNTRCGLVLVAAEDGVPQWTWMAGSHDVRRKQYCRRTARLDAVDLCQKGYLPSSGVHVGQLINKEGTFWKVVELQGRGRNAEVVSCRAGRPGRRRDADRFGVLDVPRRPHAGSADLHPRQLRRLARPSAAR